MVPRPPGRHDRTGQHPAIQPGRQPTCRWEPLQRPSSRAQLFPRPAATGVHPAHCRSFTIQGTPTTRPGAPCGARLAHDPLRHHRPGPALLALQHKILRLLRPGRPGRPAQQYFIELILLAGLVMISWPRIQAIGTTRPLAAAVDRRLAIHEGADSRPYRSNAAPFDALACAGVLQVTDRILTAEDLREALSSLAPEENRTRSGIPPTRHLIWDNSFKRHRSACSERFQLAADTIVPTFRRTGKGGLRLPSTGVDLRPEHIPACLPEDLAERHLSFPSDIAPKMRRRSASVFLVRRARGGSLDEAAHFLGISTPNNRNQHPEQKDRLHTAAEPTPPHPRHGPRLRTSPRLHHRRTPRGPRHRLPAPTPRERFV